MGNNINPETHYDMLIIGGGINGAGIARDAAGRGLKILLCEKDDLASHTSSASTKLIHGGLRYLEFYEFGLVHKALKERERLLKIAPHIIHPLEFILPHNANLRPAWLIRIGLFLYDHLGGKMSLPSSRGINFDKEPNYAIGLKKDSKRGFSYYDCRVDDSRLVVLNAMDAKALGAKILTRTTCTAIKRDSGIWRATLENNGEVGEITARSVINAAGPFVSKIAETMAHTAPKGHVKLVKGSHIIVPRISEAEHAYILQNTDNRIIFIIPYEEEYSLIGTTDNIFEGDLDNVKISEEEINYLCENASEYLERPIIPENIVASYAGVRPLYDDGAKDASEITRDFVLEVGRGKSGVAAPILNIFGGKITTYRELAEEALKLLADDLNIDKKSWTAEKNLAGGDLGMSYNDYSNHIKALYPFLPDSLRKRLVRSYGKSTEDILGNATVLKDLGNCFGGDIYTAELTYAKNKEFCQTGEDFLKRRSKLYLHLKPEIMARIDDWFSS